MNESRREPLARVVYSALYTGFAPVAPGTAGSALAALLLLLPGRLPGLPAWERPEWIAAIAVITLAGAWSARYAEAKYGKDPGVVVIDEVAGMAVTLYLIPNGVAAVVAAFFLFRFFDIVKPWPVRTVEEGTGVWGIMLDDILAGVYANVSLRLAIFLWGLLS
ncbi:MAG: phosphatidylglycerophosphatase A [Candidatus Eisenbacteria bacterium]|nr:phosphatidylglycerophosphatase A [Candidatus Eisenbacteria bacterium]